jgi:hypothetical protein
MSLIRDVYKESKKRIFELIDNKDSRVENYESPSSTFGAALLITLIVNNSLIYGKISLFIVVFYAFAVYLILKTPTKKDPFK